MCKLKISCIIRENRDVEKKAKLLIVFNQLKTNML